MMYLNLDYYSSFFYYCFLSFRLMCGYYSNGCIMGGVTSSYFQGDLSTAFHSTSIGKMLSTV